MPDSVDISAIPTVYDLDDLIYARHNTNAVPYAELRAHPDTMTIMDGLLAPYRHPEVLTPGKIVFRWATLSIVRDPEVPEGTVLLT